MKPALAPMTQWVIDPVGHWPSESLTHSRNFRLGSMLFCFGTRLSYRSMHLGSISLVAWLKFIYELELTVSIHQELENGAMQWCDAIIDLLSNGKQGKSCTVIVVLLLCRISRYASRNMHITFRDELAHTRMASWQLFWFDCCVYCRLAQKRTIF